MEESADRAINHATRVTPQIGEAVKMPRMRDWG